MPGHGHVIPNPDGSRARCGGPGICPDCVAELNDQLRRPGIVRKGTVSTPLDATTILQSLADCDVIWTIDHRRGDGFLCMLIFESIVGPATSYREVLPTFVEAAEWLHHMAVRKYPHSTYARRFG